MKFFLFFLFGLLFGFLDTFYFSFLLVISLVFLFFELGGIWFGGLFFCDSFSFFLLLLTILILIFCFFSSFIECWTLNFSSSFLFVLFSIFFLLLLSFVSLNMFFFYILFEVIFMFMFFFVLCWGYSPERVQASFYMVFYTIVVSFPFLVFVVMYSNFFKSLCFFSFYSFSSYWWTFLFLVFFVKLPVYGVHLWLPKAHVEAPVSGSMVLAGVLLKLGLYGFFRFSFFSVFYLVKFSGYFVSVGLLGGLISCFLCLRQSDLKAFVAYSSVCHMGFAICGFYCFSSYGFYGGVFMMIAHGFCSSCLFYLLYVFYERYHTRSLFLLKGVNFLFPSVGFIWFFFSALNMGVPPSFSFFSEIFILTGLTYMNCTSLFFSMLFMFFAGLYGIFLYVVSCHGVSSLGCFPLNLGAREYLIFYGHFFPLYFIPIFLTFFF